MFKKLSLFLFLNLISLTSFALTIDITGGVDNPVVIANTPFSGDSTGSELAKIIDSDLERSGYFDPVSRSQMTVPASETVNYGYWRRQSAEYMVRGKVQTIGDQTNVSYQLYNIISQELVLNGRLQGKPSQLREMAHRISDRIFKEITGIDGIFSKSILYVSSVRIGPGRFNYRLLKADSDAQNPKIILESSEPIVSPNWSPDGQSVTYVSFENGRSQIFIQNINTKRRKAITDFRGMNSAPEWSPDGKKIAFSLSKDGNAEIYVLVLSTNQLIRVTNNQYAIDTEPSWFPDSQTLLFTSNRGGQPQLYRTNMFEGEESRLSYKGSYNARGRVFPNGKGMVFVHRQGGAYRLAMQSFETGDMKILSKTSADESPNMAANSNMVIYATRRGGKSSLAVVSIDGRTRYYLPSRSRSIRDPAWSKK